MKALSDAIHAATTDDTGRASIELDKAGQEWGAHCLKNYRGVLLKRGIAITVAIAAFHDELIPKAKP